MKVGKVKFLAESNRWFEAVKIAGLMPAFAQRLCATYLNFHGGFAGFWFGQDGVFEATSEVNSEPSVLPKLL